MNTIELLLATDAGKITALPTSTKTNSRLTAILGGPFSVELTAISGDRIMELNAVMMDGSKVNFGKAHAANLLLVAEGMVSPDLKNKELQKHFGAATPKDLADKLFLGGEIADYANEIRALSGYDKEPEAEVKN